MASVSSRGNTLYFDFRYQGVRCREYTKLDNTPANRKRAEKLLRKIEAEIELGQFDYKQYFPNSKLALRFAAKSTVSGVPLFREFVEQWFTEVKVTYRHSQIQTVRGRIDKHLNPFFGARPITTIEKADILAFRAHLCGLPGRGGHTMSPSAINHTLSTLNLVMDEAGDRFECPNPCVSVKRLKVPKTDVDPFNLDEVRLIIERVREDYRNYYAVRFFTGMRTAEIHGLKWQYVDFENREILIRETIVLGRTEQTKNDGSAREIHMSQPVYDALKAQHEATAGISEYVFCTRNGSFLSNNNVSKRVWHPLLRHLGLKARRAYQTRHTAATLWLASGENPEWIARQMGHTSTEMLFRVYSRYVPNLTRNDGSAMERLLAARLQPSDAETAK